MPLQNKTRKIRGERILAGMALVSCAGSAAQFELVAPRTAAGKPNILWLTFEDTSDYMFGSYGNTQVQTPVFDSLAEKGIRFTRASSVAPQCSPARSGLISGCYPTTWGHDQHRGRRAAAPDRYLFPQWLRQAGYFCTNNRKTDWNNDESALAPFRPLAFDMNGADATYNHPSRQADQPFFAVFNNIWSHMNCVSTIGTDLREERRPGLSPDGLILPPHVPDLPAIREDYAEHLHQVEKTDAWFGVFLDDLKRRGLDEETIIFIFSDHGGCLPRGKGYPFESGFRVPLAIYVPPRWQHLSPWPPGTVTDQLVSFIDFAPTVLSLAGICPPDHMQGRAFMGRYAQEPHAYQVNVRANSASWYDPARTVSDGRFKYVRNFTPYKPHAMWHGFQSQMPAQRAWDALYLSGDAPLEFRAYYEAKPTEMLFDLDADPGELNNLVGDPDYQEKLAELRLVLSQWLRDSRDKGLVPLQMRDREPDRSMYDRMEAPDFPMEAFHSAAETASLARPEDIEAIKAMTWSDVPEIRYWGMVGCATLAQRGHLDSFDRVAELLDDPFDDIALAAAETLWFMGDATAAYSFLREAMQEGVSAADRSIEMFALKGSDSIDEALRATMIQDMQDDGGINARVILTRLGALEMDEIFTNWHINRAWERYRNTNLFRALPHYNPLIASGSGSVSTASSTTFNANASQVYALGSWQAGGDVFTAGAQISITGTMTLAGDNGNQLNDKVGFAIGHAPETAGEQLRSTGTPGESSYALYLSTTTTWPGPNERYTLAQAGETLLVNQTVEAESTGRSVDFAINILFPDTFANGENGTHVYEYELGLDYNQDGFHEVVESGTFVAYEENRIRFGFVVSKGAGATAVSLTNDYSYSIREGFVYFP